MKSVHVIGFSVLLLSLFAQAQSQFDGTWKIDTNSVQLPTKPDVFLLQNGMYECKSCVPPISIKADGTDQKVTGQPYFDTMSMKVIDDHGASHPGTQDRSHHADAVEERRKLRRRETEIASRLSVSGTSPVHLR